MTRRKRSICNCCAFPEAHQGIARTLEEFGEIAAADEHRRTGFAGRAMVPQRYRGSVPGIAVLLLVCARFGNTATQALLDDRVFAVAALYVDYYESASPLPPHALVFNAIGDADLCHTTLERAGILTPLCWRFRCCCAPPAMTWAAIF